MTAVRYYLVGGTVRDELLGVVKSKDLDFAVEASSYEVMKNWFLYMGGKIWQERPEYFTIRGKLDGQDADFVLCRKDGDYSDGRRPDSVQVGNIYDDLARRDFTMNAIAKDMQTGEYLDPHGGKRDLVNGIIKCVGKTEDRLTEDSLRMIRAIRFAITKNLMISEDIKSILNNSYYVNQLDNVSSERIYDELMKCFKYDTIATLGYLSNYILIRNYVFGSTNIWLKPTTEDK